MKVLFYNWVDNLDPENRGGGVALYQRNLMESLSKHSDIQDNYLSSGVSYNLFRQRPHWCKIKHKSVRNDGNRFEIVNSGVLAPSFFSFGSQSQVSHPPTEEAFFDFLEKTGPYDVIHFNNLEGLPVEVLRLKDRWPDTKVVFSVHNYYPICPQVNLWKRESVNCASFDKGQECRDCVLQKPDERTVRLAGAVAYNLKRIGWGPNTVIFKRGFRFFTRVARRLVRYYAKVRRAELPTDDSSSKVPKSSVFKKLFSSGEASLSPYLARDFVQRRARMLELINDCCDVVLGVSDRVSKIANAYGVSQEKLRTSYIGTKQNGHYETTPPVTNFLDESGNLGLCYLGYMRRDKGYFFLMDALEALPYEITSRIRLSIAAPQVPDGLERLRHIADRFKSVNYADGYNHGDLDEILDGATLGVVPNLWEDNLPQVAIEMHSRRIPLLTSDLGGAKELGSTPELVFEAGNVHAFVHRIHEIMDGKVDLNAYWSSARAPSSMEQHISELFGVYREIGAKTTRVNTMTSRSESAAQSPPATMQSELVQ